MWISWRDERYIVGNQHRIENCESNQVIWTEAGQFWLPKFFVWNVLELVVKDLRVVRMVFQHSDHRVDF